MFSIDAHVQQQGSETWNWQDRFFGKEEQVQPVSCRDTLIYVSRKFTHWCAKQVAPEVPYRRRNRNVSAGGKPFITQREIASFNQNGSPHLEGLVDPLHETATIQTAYNLFSMHVCDVGRYQHMHEMRGRHPRQHASSKSGNTQVKRG
jgi:hypothetical protein